MVIYKRVKNTSLPHRGRPKGDLALPLFSKREPEPEKPTMIRIYYDTRRGVRGFVVVNIKRTQGLARRNLIFDLEERLGPVERMFWVVPDA